MNGYLMRVLVVLMGVVLGGCAPRGALEVEQLRCEYRVEPEGIATAAPRLSWKLRARDGAERGVWMTGYQVRAGRGEAVVWDSGVVRGEGLVVEYAGEGLGSRDRVWWKVRVWDQEGRASDWSEEARFSVGLLEQGDWGAEWIGLDAGAEGPLTAEVREELRRAAWIRVPGRAERSGRAGLFWREFEVEEGEIAEAWIAGTADMVGSVKVNGMGVGELARWELVRPLDVRAALVAGLNAVSVVVENHDGLNPAVSGMLVVRLADGRVQRVMMDGAWKYRVLKEGESAEWRAVEVAARQPWSNARNTEHFMPPTPYLRTTFEVGKRVARATLYSSALGVYECRLNGARVGDAELAPGWTEYSKRVEHQTYDVTEMIVEGENCLGAVLGDGWYAGLMGYTGERRFYGGAARFIGQLEIEYEDGTRQVVATGPEWRAAFGPIRHTDLYMGSAYDSRLEMPGWDRGGFDAGGWRAVETGVQAKRARRADVTSRVAGAVRDGRVSMVVGPQALGDPAYGVVKTLHVEYSVGGARAEVAHKEGERLELPRAGEAGELRIHKAVFGEGDAPVPAFVIEPQRGDPVRRMEELSAKSLKEARPGSYVFDLGQNMVGWVRLKVDGKPGQRLVVRHAEMLNPDGTLYTSNLRGATATDFFTLKGGPEVLEPPFTFHGFQYVEVTGLEARPGLEMVTGIVVHTEMRPTGTFTCSSPLINQLVHNIVWGQKGNYLEVPTDCPQRDERLGWTGDAQFFVNTASYNFDIAAFMSRWLKTLCQDAQFEDGTFAHVAPKVNERGGSTAWGDAAIMCAEAMYRTYGDTRVISENFEAMCLYMRWLDGRTKEGIAKVGGYGDWVNLGDPTSQELIDTAYRAELCRVMAELAGVIGRTADRERFERDREVTMRAFRARFLNEDGSLRDSGQTGYALAFTMGLIPEEVREAAGRHFAGALERKDWHLATGFIGTPRLLPGLHAAGREGDAARLLLNETYPSWLYQVKLGATTMWERWDGWTPERGFQDVGMNSFNHYAFGSVGDYLYRHVAGISALAPAYAKVRIAPTLVTGLTHADASYDSMAGVIRSAWRREDGAVVYDITVPPSVRAEVRLVVGPGCEVREGGKPIAEAEGVEVVSGGTGEVVLSVGSGVYQFVVGGP